MNTLLETLSPIHKTDGKFVQVMSYDPKRVIKKEFPQLNRSERRKKLSKFKRILKHRCPHEYAS